jgi:murein DD-endopeptidase MepM/ murein hydrolase activator NlpD
VILPDETPTSELPVVTEPKTAEPAARRLVRRLAGKHSAVLALAAAATLSVAGVAIASGTGGDAPAAGPVSLSVPLPTQTGPMPTPSRAAPSRGGRPAPTATSPATPARPETPAWVPPMRNFHVNSCYGARWGRMHQGIDFAGGYGARIYAVHAGVVVTAGRNSGGYGNFVVIRHSSHLFTAYGHASRLLVHAGQKVATGQKIALEGATGHVTWPNLHFEVWTAMWQRIDPGPFLAKRGIELNRCQ